MHFALLALDGRGAADHVDGLNAVARISEAITAAGQNLLVAHRMQVGEAFRELKLLAADVDVAEGRLLALHIGRQIVGVDGQEPAHTCALVFEVARRLCRATVVHHVALQLAEDEVQHVVEVHADVGRHAERLAVVTLPAFHVPLAARGDVGQLDVELGVRGCRCHLVAQLQDGVVMAQLQDVEDALAGFLFNALQFVDEVRRGHQGLLADHVATQAQARGDVRVMQVVGAADRHIVQRGRGVALELLRVLVEAFELGEELTLRRNAVDEIGRAHV